MTASEITTRVQEMLEALNVDEDTVRRLADNMWFSPYDLFAIAEALEKLNVANSEVFVALVADADSFDLAKFHRYRAELLANESVREHLGTLGEFVVVSDMVLNRNNEGALVAAFPLDVVAWTESVQANFTRFGDEIAVESEAIPPIFAVTGDVTETANSEMQRRGWTLIGMD